MTPFSIAIAEAELAGTPPEWGIRRDALGIHALGRVEYEIRNGKIVYADHGPVGVLVTEHNHLVRTACCGIAGFQNHSARSSA